MLVDLCDKKGDIELALKVIDKIPKGELSEIKLLNMKGKFLLKKEILKLQDKPMRRLIR